MSMSSLSSLSEDELESPRAPRNNPPKLDGFVFYNDDEFRQRFRLNKRTVMHITQLIEERIQPSTRRNRAVQARDQVLVALRFFATGSFQKVIGDIFGLQQPSVHRIVHRVADAIAALSPSFIKMPTSAAEQEDVVNNFFAIAGFPRVLGALDCTHIKTISPGGTNAETFRNRKGYFSLNVQAVCDSSLLIRSLIARWPGSVHDSTIFNDSPLCAQFERGDFRPYLLLGDSGYPCRSYLLTPVSHPVTPAQEAYNRAQISTRNPVERLFGVFKRRFPCLQNGLAVKIERVPVIIVACAVLYNIAIMQNDVDNDMEINNTNADEPALDLDANHDEYDNVRTEIIENFFS